MLYFNCNVCRASLSADEQQAGQLVRCPNCLSTMNVPSDAAVPAGAAAAGDADLLPPRSPPPPPPRRQTTVHNTNAGGGRRYGFNCVYCSSRLEAVESMAAQEGQCPTCGSEITIPILDRYGRLIDPVTKEILKPDPHPVHAYAAAGERAPKIDRLPDGSQTIRCAKCGRSSPITSNSCKHCGMPFTMEGTTPQAAGTSNGFAVASLVLGIIGVPFSCSVIVPALAVIFGIVALVQIGGGKAEGSSGKGLAIGGIACGAIGLFISARVFLF
jgi:DNA-directed RNA polymerase subunit RPC12/RpoP